ncbi:hypothetical protein Sinac_0280 [Singulisphaera acidiphila DSM 18658]|uniref:Uncharacterized protein n=1 Tax=Singulisphaera acidiphila (strain ATCC BAA-1392 / DSM 18658 / VKM B-2454 / MOB10) TaxID=886293 RepID=L0D785_SINAD|nr:hypothetical protein Sinac_0280 [Singulisphaera acidiphila DSM 18658]
MIFRVLCGSVLGTHAGMPWPWPGVHGFRLRNSWHSNALHFPVKPGLPRQTRNSGTSIVSVLDPADREERFETEALNGAMPLNVNRKDAYLFQILRGLLPRLPLLHAELVEVIAGLGLPPCR